MTQVFVDDMMDCAPNANWKYSRNCHLFVEPETDPEVLHVFAESIGLRRNWFQSGGTMPHYDLTASKRKQAVRRGAEEADNEHVVRCIRAWRKHRKGAASGKDSSKT